MLRCKISLHPKISEMLTDMHIPISQPYKLIINTYLLIHSKNLAKMALNNLYLESETGNNFPNTELGRKVSNMYFTDLINYEQKLDEIIESIKLLIHNGYLGKGIKKEIKKLLKLVIQNKKARDIGTVISVWEALSFLLTGFATSVLSKVYNKGVMKSSKTKRLRKITHNEKTEMIRLEAFIYLAVAFNEMDIFLSEYAGETML